jgi:signal transduction histidine kinase
MTSDTHPDSLTHDETTLSPDAYEEILTEYIRTHSETALYQVSLLSSQLIEGGLGPEDIIALHFECCDRAMAGQSYRERARSEADSQQFLLEVMIAYGVRFKEYLEIRLRESMSDAQTRIEEERQRVLDAERMGRQKDDLLAVIAHELRTPITAARGNLDLARRMLNRGDTEHATGLLDSARQAMDRLSRLSADLVEANRDEMPELVLGTLDLGPILTLACDWAANSIESEGITIRREAADAPALVIGNEDALLSVFGNLISNAVRYTRPGGTVTVREGQDRDRAWAEISDTGIGMSEDVQSRIFEKFFRAPEARTMEVRGLGLGLTLVQKLVNAHSGDIEITSEVGRGTTFRVSLPLVVREGA